MSKRKGKLTIFIDNKKYSCETGSTILEAAEQSGVYIPTLCAHTEMSPFGGCRMCIVEVEGMRGFPTSCTTPVADGMKIMTHTAQIQEERKEILQLILSEHTSSCLICDERLECKESTATIRKVGVTTGCRYCPSDQQCELQDVVEYLGVEEIGYPVYYRNLKVEKNDPFYDRDYNLCILCGRCIRMCQEVRTANILAFKQRGRNTVIGPAFERTHLEAGCEFCGACVSTCPTGALSEKARKWEGKADYAVTTTCAFCGTGCRLDLQVKGKKVIGSLPAGDSHVSDRQLCVKGRFCVTELVNSHKRIKKPFTFREGHRFNTNWKEAIGIAAGILSSCKPEEFGMIVSSDCTNEDLYIAQKFTRSVMGSHNINTEARIFYGQTFNAYLDLFELSTPISDIAKSDLVLSVGIDTRFSRSVIGVELRKAISAGARLVTINSEEHNLVNIAVRWIRPEAGGESAVLKALCTAFTGKSTNDKDIAYVSGLLRQANKITILVGSQYPTFTGGAEILGRIKDLALKTGAGITPLPPQCNFVGTLLAGVYSEILPGGLNASNKKSLSAVRKGSGAPVPAFKNPWQFDSSAAWKKIKVLYLVGDFPLERYCSPDHLIYQNIFGPRDTLKADLVLPARAFSEIDGTIISGEGRIQKIKKAADSPGEAKADWNILCMIARKMGKKGFGFSSAAGIRKELSTFVPGVARSSKNLVALPIEGRLLLGRTKKIARADKKRYPFILNAYSMEHLYHGNEISETVEGAAVLFGSGRLEVNPVDARKLRIKNGDEVIVTSPLHSWRWTVKISEDQLPETLRVTLAPGEVAEMNPQRVKIRRK